LSEASWRRHFGEAYAFAATRAGEAWIDRRLIACGFTSNVDRVATLDRALVARLYGETIIAGDLPRVTRGDTVDELLAGIAQCVAAGEGTDLPLRPEVQAWLLERMDGRMQVGGTGAQAAATLATLGFPTLLHLTGRSPEQIEVLPHREAIVVGGANGISPVDAVVAPEDATMWHPVLEFDAGLRAPLPGRPAAPAPNRVLMHDDPVNAAFSIDPGFDAALANPGIAIGAALVSGFSQVGDEATRERLLQEVAAAVRRWRMVRPELVIHLELGAMPDFAAVARIVEVLHPVVTSIGMNIDELRGLLEARGETMAAPGPGLVAQMRALAARYPTPRFSVHTREFCLTLTEEDPAREMKALLFGSLVAATRSRIGAFPAFADLEATLEMAEANAEGLEVLRALGVSPENEGEAGVVATPGLAVAAVASVGLGDSFTGAMLAILDQETS
jgi:ADP-dependent phosphofructokinase/glucokinase